MASIPLLRLSLRSAASLTAATHCHRKTPTPSLSLLHFHPLKSPPTRTLPIRNPTRKPKTLKRNLTVSMSSSITPATDRLISAVSYFLPFLNSLHYGRFLLAQYPVLSLLFEPLLPIFSIYKSVPYASFVAFFGLYLGVVRNPSLSHYVRFNAMQALVLDVLLVLPMLLQRIFTPGRAGLGFKLMVMGHNALFVFVVMCFIYSWVCSLLGRTPYLPFVADAAGRQV